MLEDLIKNQTNPTLATYITNNDVQVRITAKCKKGEDAEAIMAPVQAEVLRRLGSAVYEVGELELHEVVAQMLIDKNRTLAVAESCTGGWLTSLLVQRAGAFSIFDGRHRIVQQRGQDPVAQRAGVVD